MQFIVTPAVPTEQTLTNILTAKTTEMYCIDLFLSLFLLNYCNKLSCAEAVSSLNISCSWLKSAIIYIKHNIPPDAVAYI